MIHFNALDFTVCRSEEVTSFFWRSVYMYLLVKFLIFQIIMLYV